MIVKLPPESSAGKLQHRSQPVERFQDPMLSIISSVPLQTPDERCTIRTRPPLPHVEP